METYKKFSEEQRRRGAELQEQLASIINDGTRRKTREYIKKKEIMLNNVWREFRETHKELEELDMPTEKYFSQNFYRQARQVYEKAMSYIQKYSLSLDAELEEIEEELEQTSGDIEKEVLQTNDKNTNEESKNQDLSMSETETPARNYDEMPDFVLRNEDKQKNLSSEEQNLRIKKQTIRMSICRRAIHDVIRTHRDKSNTYCQFKVKEISELWSNINNLHEEILIFATADDIQHTYFQEKEYETLEKIYRKVMVNLHEAMEVASCATKNQQIHEAYEIKLPRITIPIFDGNYTNWTSFRDIYVKVIHNNNRLGNAEKMHYLKTSLSHEAIKLIQHLTSSDVNYQAAWELINNRFDNKRILFSTHIDTLLNQPASAVESALAIKQLHDTTRECMHAIGNLNIEVLAWSPLIAHIILKKLDKETTKLYEQSLREPREIPQLEEVLTFLENRFQSLEAVGEPKRQDDRNAPIKQERMSSNKSSEHQHKNGKVKNHLTLTAKSCKFCNGQHKIYTCRKFQEKTVGERFNFIKQNKICVNCLNHDVKEKCFSTSKCSICKRQHHTLLHQKKVDNNSKEQTTPRNISAHASMPEIQQQGEHSQEQVTVHVGKKVCNILLATALIKAKTVHNTYEYLRALIDPGSQATFISEHAAQMLGIPRTKIQTQISGMGKSNAGVSHSRVELELTPRYPSKFTLLCEALVLSTLTSTQPDNCIEMLNDNNDKWTNLVLADPTFNIPGPIDLVIGADIFTDIIMNGVQKTEDGVLAQETQFGWILSGRTGLNLKTKNNIVSMISRIDIDAQLRRFWEIEEMREEETMSSENQKCEKYYEETTKRNKDGTYTVKIPFKETEKTLGDSKQRALARLYQMEKRFLRDNVLRENYNKFMQEYLELGHMKLITPKEKEHIDSAHVYYMPHQAVLKPDSSTTKLRVVFDASTKTSSGLSLNEIMLNGPKLQQDLQYILLRWRKHKYVYTADVEKMYRQIKIADDHQHFQRILWRPSTSERIEEYRLTTVTYGTKSAPYLAIKTLQTLAQDESKEYPQSAEIIKRDFYVDDLMSGSNSLEDAKRIQQELITVLRKGGLNLRKWKANHIELIENLDQELKDHQAMEITEVEAVKTLGVFWTPTADAFHFKVKLKPAKNVPTKRIILSEIAKLYDPLGWLSPVIVKAKLLLQELWIEKYTWDQPLAKEIATKWERFRNDLSSVENIKIPRWINYSPGVKLIEIHGFSDASEKAYGAVLYSKVITDEGKTHITLLASKTKVAPVKKEGKKSITLPRLELCAAVLLAKLIKQTKTSLQWDDVKVNAWTDSTITLAWISGSGDKYDSFVSSRVRKIHEMTKPSDWQHVRSEHNPADLASRGVEPHALKDKTLWWRGPLWLENTEEMRTITETRTLSHTEHENEMHAQALIAETMDKSASAGKYEILNRYSSLKKLTNVIAYCSRVFVKKLQKVHTIQLAVEELEKAQHKIIRMTQEERFEMELKLLKTKKPIHSKSIILSLRPFVDEQGILRVGGRLKNSNISHEEKHPIILPSKHNISNLIINEAHIATLHGGNEATLAYIRRKYWIVYGRSEVKQQLKKCVKCCRFKGQSISQVMGELPAPRVRSSKPFTHTGVDYAGPVQIRTTKGRGMKSYKGYLAIFICLCTKAMHIEAVSDMTTDSFLAAFRRFAARRGLPSHMYSDNGTTFVGANRVMDKDVQKAVSELSSAVLSLASEGVKWHFIPPAAPHFGGIWEAGVKSVKYHLKRIIGESTLTFEEMCTLLYQIEACLNSRPLYPVTNDPENTQVLTPAHFLIGQALITPIEPNRLGVETHSLTRWKLVQKITQDFWKKWQTEYLSRLQQRTKWKSGVQRVKVGDIVLIKDETCPPTRWPLAKITQVHPGDDDIVRVVTLKGKENTLIKRPVTKICLLPVENESHIPTEQHKDANRASVSCNIMTTNTIVTTLSQEKPHPIRKHRRNKMLVTPLTLLLTTLMIVSYVPQTLTQYTIKQPQPGLYVEHAGDVRINRGTLKVDLTTPFNITKEYKRVKEIVDKMEKACDQATRFKTDTHCSELLDHLKEKRLSIENELDILKNMAEKRVKRGLLGRLLETVFGVNEEVYTNIEHLEKNQELLKRTMHQQNSMMISTTTSINELHAQTNQKIGLITTKLNNVIQEVNKIEGWYEKIDANKVGIQLLAAYQISNDLLSDMENQYFRITTAETKSILEFISPGKLHKIIADATKKLPTSLLIVERPENRVQIEVNETNMIISGFLHITEVNTYHLSKITPIPQKTTDNKYIVPDISSSFLAVDYNNQRYFELSEDEIKSCTSMGKHIFLCRPKVVSQIDTNANCAIDQLYHRKTMKECPVKEFIVPTIVWKHLYFPNTWLFVASTATEAAIICNGHREDVLLEDVGIIQIHQECLIRTQKNTLLPAISNQVSIKGTFLKPLNFTSLTINSQASTFRSEPIEPILSTADTWDKLSEDDTNDDMLGHWQRIIHHSATASISITITIISIIALWRCRRCYSCKKWTPNKKINVDEDTPDFVLRPLEKVSTPSMHNLSEHPPRAQPRAGRMSTQQTDNGAEYSEPSAARGTCTRT